MTRRVPGADGGVQRVGRLLAIVEPAPREQRVAHRERIEGVLVAGRDAHRHALRFRLTEDRQPFDRPDAVDHADAGVDGELGEPEVALDAEVVERGPRRGHGQRGPCALHAGARVEAAEPVVEHEGLVAAQRLGAVEHHRRALRRVAELVQVGADGGDAVHPEVPRRHVVAQLLDEREQEAAHAGVGVEAGARVGGHGRELGDGVDHALRVLRRAAHHQHRVRPDGLRHGVDVGPPVVADGHLVQADPEVVRGLVEGSMGAGRHDHLGLGDAALLAAALARRP